MTHCYHTLQLTTLLQFNILYLHLTKYVQGLWGCAYPLHYKYSMSIIIRLSPPMPGSKLTSKTKWPWLLGSSVTCAFGCCFSPVITCRDYNLRGLVNNPQPTTWYPATHNDNKAIHNTAFHITSMYVRCSSCLFHRKRTTKRRSVLWLKTLPCRHEYCWFIEKKLEIIVQ